MEILEFFERHRTPFFDKFFLAVTYLGWETIFLIFALVLIWCVNKKYGFFILYCGLIGQTVTQFLKMICKVERPWIVHPDFKPVAKAMKDAGGFSFPSGHTQIATTTYGGIALLYRKKKALSISLVVITLLIAISRMYLGVHYPSDVLFSLVFNTFLVVGFYAIGKKYSSDTFSFILRTFAVLIIGGLFAYSIISCTGNSSAEMTETYEDSIKFASKMLGATIAFVVSWFIDDKYLNFTTSAPFYKQIIKVVVGAAVLLAFKEGLKALFVAVNFPQILADSLRYFVVVFFAGTVWPYVFMHFVKRK